MIAGRRQVVDPRRSAQTQTMTAPNPEPAETTGLDSGGGVPPGETPPSAAGTSSAHYQPPTAGGRGLSVALVVALGIVVLLIVVGFVGKLLGLF